MIEPAYLGDGAYVRVENGMVCLYTSNGIEETNKVYLELEVLRRFLEWLKANKIK